MAIWPNLSPRAICISYSSNTQSCKGFQLESEFPCSTGKEGGPCGNLGWGLFPAPKFVYWYICASLLTCSIRDTKLSAHQYGDPGSELRLLLTFLKATKYCIELSHNLCVCFVQGKLIYLCKWLDLDTWGSKRREASACLSKSRWITLCQSYRQTQPQFLAWKKRTCLSCWHPSFLVPIPKFSSQ